MAKRFITYSPRNVALKTWDETFPVIGGKRVDGLLGRFSTEG